MVVQGKELDMLKRKVTDYSTQPWTESEVTEFVGRSLFIQKETVRVMSDVWDDCFFLTSIDATGKIAKYGIDESKPETWQIDATEEVYSDYSKDQFEVAKQFLTREATDSSLNPAVKGRVVKVTSGRTGKGTVGKVVVVMMGNYGMGYRSVPMQKLGIATSPRMVDKVMPNGKVFQNYADMIWVWAKNCEVEKPQEIDLAMIDAKAREKAYTEVQALREQTKYANDYNARFVRRAA
jgi:hypothetical protein